MDTEVSAWKIRDLPILQSASLFTVSGMFPLHCHPHQTEVVLFGVKWKPMFSHYAHEI